MMSKPSLYQTTHQSKLIWLLRGTRTATSLHSRWSQGQLWTWSPPAPSEHRGICTPTPSGDLQRLPAHLMVHPERQSMAGPSTTAGVAAATRPELRSRRRGSHRAWPCTLGEHRYMDPTGGSSEGKEVWKPASLYGQHPLSARSVTSVLGKTCGLSYAGSCTLQLDHCAWLMRDGAQHVPCPGTRTHRAGAGAFGKNFFFAPRTWPSPAVPVSW